METWDLPPARGGISPDIAPSPRVPAMEEALDVAKGPEIEHRPWPNLKTFRAMYEGVHPDWRQKPTVTLEGNPDRSQLRIWWGIDGDKAKADDPVDAPPKRPPWPWRAPYVVGDPGCEQYEPPGEWRDFMVAGVRGVVKASTPEHATSVALPDPDPQAWSADGDGPTDHERWEPGPPPEHRADALAYGLQGIRYARLANRIRRMHERGVYIFPDDTPVRLTRSGRERLLDTAVRRALGAYAAQMQMSLREYLVGALRSGLWSCETDQIRREWRKLTWMPREPEPGEWDGWGYRS